jgi:putative component of toxin-antitoxin plasmid stabilization module
MMEVRQTAVFTAWLGALRDRRARDRILPASTACRLAIPAT